MDNKKKYVKKIRCELYNDNFQNYKKYHIPKKAQLVIADIPYCYDELTECFTEKGWKKYYQITKEDKVLSLNPITLEMKYSNIANIIIKDNTETMIHFENQNLDLFVTENHRMFTHYSFTTRSKTEKTNKIGTGIRLAKDISKNCYVPRSGYKFIADENIDFITIPSCEINTNGNEHIKPEIKIDIDIWLNFFGLWLADGCIHFSKAKNGRQLYTIGIKQAGENRKRVREILEKLPFKYYEYEYSYKGTTESNFNINSKQLWLFLKKFGKSNKKYIPNEYLKLPADKLKILWESYIFGDSTKNGKGLKISSVSKRLIENLQEVALKLGVICQIREQENVNWKSKLYYFQFNENSRNIKYSNKKIIGNYNKKVWCLTLETNSVFLVRRNNKIMFSGNCLGNNAFASSLEWYVDGDNKKGESKKAGSSFFKTDINFNLAEYMHFCSKLLIKEPKEKGKAPAMIIFCAFQQIETLVKYAKKHGFNNYYPLIFIKHSSSQVLKANMKIVGATEYALVFYRDKLPKFNNNGKMIKNWFEWKPDSKSIYPKVHPTQKPVNLLKTLIRIFTDPGDTVIDPVAGSGSTLRAAKELNRNSYGFEVEKEFYKKATTEMLREDELKQLNLF